MTDALPPQPVFGPHHESNVPGLFVVGDIADAPLISAAWAQGHAVGAHLRGTLRPCGEDGVLDVVIIGAGPAGLGAAAALQGSALAWCVVEREAPLSTLSAFPRGKMLYWPEAPPPGAPPWRDGPREAVVEAWLRHQPPAGLPLRCPATLAQLQRVGGRFTLSLDTPEGAVPLRACAVVLAVGKRGQPVPLGVPGAGAVPVQRALGDAAAFAGQDVLVVGGGDSAGEDAVQLAAAGARVTLVHRGADFPRMKPSNRAGVAAAAAAGHLRVRLRSALRALEPAGTGLRATLDTPDGPASVQADALFARLGARPPLALLRAAGVRLRGAWDARRVAWVGAFAVFTWLFYLLKAGADCVGGTGAACTGGAWVARRPHFPVGPGDPLAGLPGLLHADLGFRTVDGAFWGTVAYTLAIAAFGVRAMARHRGPGQRARYAQLIGFQAVFLFGVPELLAPLVIDRPWKAYALSVPWPLSIWSLVDAPSWAGGDTAAALGWLAAGAVSSFILIPLYVRRNGQAFCSTLCGCGGLAETVGDLFRDLAPRGPRAQRAEWGGRLVFALAVPVTGLLLADAWGLVRSGAWADTTAFARHWYGLAVDFALASVLGVALYPVLGNRFWCRFWCPLRAWMEVLAARIARPVITSTPRCISCGACTRHCQMGIEVMSFAQRQEPLHNGNAACIQCGICVEVCPMDVLRLEAGRPVELGDWAGALAPPRAPFA